MRANISTWTLCQIYCRWKDIVSSELASHHENSDIFKFIVEQAASLTSICKMLVSTFEAISYLLDHTDAHVLGIEKPFAEYCERCHG